MVATPVAMDAQYPLSASLPASPGQSDFLRWMKQFVSEGVYYGDLSSFGVIQRGAGADMSVDVLPGRGIVRAAFYEKGTTVNLPISPNATGLTRIDLIVIRLTAGTPVIQLAVVEGTAGAGVPAATRTLSASGIPVVWEVVLAQISVPSGTLSILTAQITDLRQFASGQGLTPATTVASASALIIPAGKSIVVRVSGTTTVTTIAWPASTTIAEGSMAVLHFTSAGCQVTHSIISGIHLADNRNYISGVAVGSLLGLVYEASAWREVFRVGEQLAQNVFLAGPTGSAGLMLARAIANADIAANLLGHDKLAQATQNLFLMSPNGSTGNIAARAPVNADFPVNVLGHDKLAQATQNLVVASPNGSTGNVSARALVAADIAANLLTHDKLAQATQNLFMMSPNGSTGNITARTPVNADFAANMLALAKLVNSASTFRVIGAAAAGAWAETALTSDFIPALHQFITATGSASGPTFANTSFADLEGDGPTTLLRQTFTLTAGATVFALATVSVSHGTSGQPVYLRLSDDISAGVRGEVAGATAAAGQLLNLFTFGMWSGLTAVAHTISVQGRVDAGTATLNGTRRHLLIIEIKK